MVGLGKKHLGERPWYVLGHVDFWVWVHNLFWFLGISPPMVCGSLWMAINT